MRAPDEPKAWQGTGWAEGADLAIWNPKIRAWLEVGPASAVHARVKLIAKGFRGLFGPRPKPRPLTGRQIQILRYVAHHLRTRGYPPGYRDVMGFFRIHSTSGVSYHLRALERRGYVQRSRYRSRTTMVTARGFAFVDAPITVVPPKRCRACGREHYLPRNETCAPCRNAALERDR